jgi:acyl-CoA synthetase (AMP-forming)/AMP-acid ligase II/acyl carrier protein
MSTKLSLDVFWRNLRQGGDAPFIVSDEGNTTYATFCQAVAGAMSAYRKSSMSAGDRVVISVAKEVEGCAAFVAAIIAGHVPVIVSADAARPRFDAICRAVEPACLVMPAGGARPDWTCPVIDSATFSQHAADGGEIAPPAGDPSALAYILFTSGTTAEPSGVEITLANLLAHLETIRRLFGFGPSTRVFNPVPISHTDGIVLGPLLAMATGGSVIRPGPFDVSDVETWLGGIRRHGATHMVTNPTVLSLIERLGAHNDYFGETGFKGIVSSASQLSKERWERFERRFGTELWNLYGLTETVTTALYAGRHPEMGSLGTIGRPIDCEARLGDSAGVPLPEDATPEGEIQLRGDHIFRGYWRNPVRTQQTFTPDGWMRTGDLARRHADGSYEFLGRLKAAINSGGTLIRGEEIDEALLRHPSVVEAVTVGLKDADFEEIAVSAVVLSRAVGEAALTEHCRNELEALKVPKRIFAVDAIPRGPSGKPRLAEVRAMLEDRAQAPSAVTSSSPSTVEDEVMDLAAIVFRAERARLSMASSPETVSGWDSFTHINLILQAEADFGLRIPNRFVKSVRTLGDLVAVIRQIQSK